MSIKFTGDAFPVNVDVKETSAVPWGAVIRPFAPLDSGCKLSTNVEDAARCQHCKGYINPFVLFHRHSWQCALCRQSTGTPPRYASAQDRRQYSELSREVVEYVATAPERATGPRQHGSRGGSAATDSASEEDGSEDDEKDTASRISNAEYPAYVFLVDLSGDSQYVEVSASSCRQQQQQNPNFHHAADQHCA